MLHLAAKYLAILGGDESSSTLSGPVIGALPNVVLPAIVAIEAVAFHDSRPLAGDIGIILNWTRKI